MAQYTRKTYVMIADAFASALADFPEDREGLRTAASRISAKFADDNPRYSAALFLKACGFGS